ncbi:MAG: protein translocase subunit SecD, partial [Ferruginibacter sp.]|nr:protein translocase subunit SecD [Ferruginibacter sp.]
WELSYTVVVRNYEASVKTVAERFVKSQHPEATGEDKNALVKVRMRHILDSTKEKSIYPIVGTSYQKCKENELNLGLDLQGGMSVTMEVSLEGLLKSISNNPKNPTLVKALQTATAQKVAKNEDYITLFSSAFAQQNPGTPLASLFAGAGKQIKVTDNDDKVISQIRIISKGAINETYKILLKRIDKFGVAQPNINLDENKGIIQVELAGVTDKERVRKYLQASANLQFWSVYNLDEIGKGYENAATSLGAFLSGTSDSSKVIDSAKKAQYATALFSVMSPQDISGQKIPYNKQYSFYTRAQDTSKLNYYLSLDAVRGNFPADSKILYGVEETPEKGTKYIPIYVVKTLPGGEKAAMDGESVEEAFQGFDERGSASIKMNMTVTGAKKWADLTKNNVGRPVAIALDDIVYTAPNVMGAIEGGQTEITGKFSTEEAQDLSNILKSGKTNAPAKIVAEQVVGPTLGEASVNGGMMAFGISFLVIFALMFLYYNTGGWVANISLILNLLFTIGVLSAMGFTLTAAGIAGLVLTVGLAVDTNVIIFERIKEELTKGKNYPQAVSDGYKRSLAPVIDAHVTTFLTAAILFVFGLGPVLGFATTQMLGIVLSLFCGILVSRLITDFWTSKDRHFNYFTGISKRVYKHASFKFIEYRKVAYGISVVVLILGVASYFYGFHEGVEFKGGRSYTVAFPQAVKNDAVRDDLKTAFEGDFPIIKTVGDNKHLNITTSYKKGVDNADSLVQTKLYQGLQKVLPGISYAEFAKNNILSSQTVQPTISED